MKLNHCLISGALLSLIGSTSLAFAQEWLTPKPMTPAQQQRPQQQQQQQQQQQRPAQQSQQQRVQDAQPQQQQRAPATPQVVPQQVGPELAQAFGDWRISCVSKPGRACQITQRQVSSQNARALVLMVELTVMAQPASRNILSVMTPLGAKLGPALAIEGDGSEVASAPLVTCLNTGCIHSGDIAAKNVDALRRSKALSTKLSDLKGQSTAVAISTRGLEDAFQRVASYLKGG
jgi:invasion protein IalB